MSWHVAQSGSVVTTTTTTPPPTFTPVTNPGACPDDSVSWGDFGPPGTLVATGSSAFTPYGNIAVVSNAGSVNLVVRKEKPCTGGDFDGNFNACDDLIATNLSGTPAGEIDVWFSDPVGGVSAQVQPVATGAFTAKLRAYDAGDNLLYTGTNTGNNTGAGSPGDNTAPWLGVTSSGYVIKRVKYSLNSAGGGDTLQLAINKLFVCPTPTTTTTTLPPTVWPPTLACPSLSLDYIDWKNSGLYGGPNNSLVCPFATNGVNNTPVIISRPGMTLFNRFRESPCSGANANGSYAACDEGIATTNLGPPTQPYVAFQFINGLSAFGVRMASDAFGQYTARLKVYDVSNHLLGETTVTGSNNGCVTPGDNLVPFLGLKSDSNNIYRAEVSIDSAAGNTETYFNLASTFFCTLSQNQTYQISDGAHCLDDYFDWSTKGAAGTSLANGFSVTSSVNSLTTQVFGQDTGFVVRKEKPCSGADLDGEFAACDWVLECLKDVPNDAQGALTIDFGQDVGCVAMRVSGKATGTYTVTLHVYDVHGSTIGTYTVNGNNTGGSGTDTAPWVGAGAWNNNIRSIDVSVTASSATFPWDMEVGRVYFGTVSNTTTTTASPVTTPAPPAVEYFSDPSTCTTDYVDWSAKGVPGSTIAAPNNVTSNGGTALWFDNPGAATFKVHKQGSCASSDFTGDFTPCDFLLKTVTTSPTPEGWIEVAFTNPVRGVITQIQAKDAGAFVARVRAYDAYGNELGTATVNGTSGTAANGSAPQLGIRTVAGGAAIRWVRYSLDSAGSGNLQEFYVNRLKFCT
jgi:hypothetical protein